MRITPHPLRLLLLLCVAAVAAPAGAQAPATDPPGGLAGKSLEDLMSVEVGTVFGAAKREQRVTEAPSSVTIVTAEEIRTFGWRTMAEVLASVRGFYTTNDRNYTYVGVRGFGRPSDYNNRVLVLVNGHRYNDNVYDQALLGNDFPIDLALVQRVEIIRGPGSALYGTSAFFAVINVVLRPGSAVGGGESSIEVGTLEAFRARVSYGKRLASGADALLSVTRTSSEGQELLYYPEYDAPGTNFGRSRDADRESSTSLAGSYGRGRFSLQGTYSTRDKLIPTGAYGTVLDATSHTTDSRFWLDAMLTGAFKGAALTGRAFTDYSGYRGSYHYIDGDYVADDTADGVWAGVEGTASRRVGARHQLTGGVELRRNFRQDQRNWNVDPYVVNVDARYSSNQVAIFVQDELSLTRQLTATLGLRYDWWGPIGGTATPRVGLVYRTDANTAVKALFGEAYRAPTVYESDYFPETSNRPLRPERLDTSELVLERYLGQSLRFTATGYLTNARNLISQVDSTTLFYFQNWERTQSRGIEIEAERRWSTGILLRGSVVEQRTHDRRDHAELSNSPRRLALLHAAAPVWDRRLTFAAESQYVGSRLSTLGSDVPGVWLTNLNVTFTPPRSRLSFAAHVANLFDKAYGQPVGLEFRQDVMPQDGRTASIRATLRF